MCPTGWACCGKGGCQEEIGLRDHDPHEPEMAELYNLFAEVENASAVFGIKEGHVRDVPLLDGDEKSDGDDDFVADEASATSSSDGDSGASAASSSSDTESDASGESTGDGASESSNASGADAATPVDVPRLRPRLPTVARLQQLAQEGLRARLRHILRNLEQLRAHKIRTVKFSLLRKDQLRDLDHYTVMEWKDYMGKLEARKSQQGSHKREPRQKDQPARQPFYSPEPTTKHTGPAQGRRLVQVPAGGRRLLSASKHVWRI